MTQSVRILFVCMGNICRSPTAHGVFEKLVRDRGYADRILIDSAGTHAYHVAEPPDRRAQEAARRREIDISRLRARKAVAKDFERFDYLLAMDEGNYQDLLAISPAGLEHKVQLFLQYAPQLQLSEVPDPYYGGPAGFERVLDMVEHAAEGLLEHLIREHRL